MTKPLCPEVMASDSSSEVLGLGLFDFQSPMGKSLTGRCEPFREWVDESSQQGFFQFLRHHLTAPDVTSSVLGWGGQHYRGINLASQDYLGLARHPAVVEAAVEACRTYGTHSSGSEPMGGGLAEGKILEEQLAEFIQHEHVVLFPTGWGAGYGGIKALVRPHDYVVLDALAHDCLQHGARSSTGSVSLFAHNDPSSLYKRLARIRRSDPEAAILVVTESLFSMDSDHPDFRQILAACHEHDAYLMVDVAHDLGLLGPEGRGVLAEQEVLKEVDFLIGSFSKTFACIGGFFASHSKAASYYVRGFSGSYTFSNYLIPAQVAAVKAALGIIRSEEGNTLRDATLRSAELMREQFEERGVEVLGRISSMVLPMIGPESTARMAYRRCLEEGIILNNIEFPACRRGQARFRLQVTPRHTDSQLQRAVSVVAEALQASSACFPAVP
jgi:glycine C-acetyltransferase